MTQKKSVFTICMDATAAGRNVGGQCEIRNPQIFDVNIAKRFNKCLIKSFAREHRCDWIR